MSTFHIHDAPNNPSQVCARNDLSLEAKGIYCILTCVRREENETHVQKLERCCIEEDEVIKSAILELQEAGLIQ